MNRFTLMPLAVLATLALVDVAHADCKECGTVSAVKTIKSEGQNSAVGVVAGGLIGGVLGHQVGGGRGNTLATIAGAGAGAYAGNEVAKNQNAKTTYRVVVTMEDGASRHFDYAAQTSYKVGDRIKVVNGKLTRP